MSRTRFKPSHALTYGVRVSQRASGTSEVLAVECLFCIFFGREEKCGSKRKRTSNVKHYKTFRVDHYAQHNNEQHPDKWSEYKAASDEEKKKVL